MSAQLFRLIKIGKIREKGKQNLSGKSFASSST